MTYKYAFETNKENHDAIVKVGGADLSISHKQAIEMCSFIKNMTIEKARNLLEKVITKDFAIPFKRFTEGAGHKKGIGSGKYPVTTAKQFLKLLNSLEANAQNKGLGTDLVIIHACAKKASRPAKQGRQRGQEAKRTHVELVAKETEQKKKVIKKQATKKATVSDKNSSLKPESIVPIKKQENNIDDKNTDDKVTKPVETNSSKTAVAPESKILSETKKEEQK